MNKILWTVILLGVLRISAILKKLNEKWDYEEAEG